MIQSPKLFARRPTRCEPTSAAAATPAVAATAQPHARQRRLRRAALLLLPLAALLFSFAAPALRASDELVVTADDKAFFVELKRAVLAHDAAWVAAHVALPLHVRIDEHQTSIRTSKEFVESYDRIITLALVKIVNKQTAEFLFKNSRGVMIGDGEIWFARDADNADAVTGKPSYRIIAIGGATPPRETPAAGATPKTGG